jgi:hypothetical protein
MLATDEFLTHLPWVIDTREIDDGDADAFGDDCLPHPLP